MSPTHPSFYTTTALGALELHEQITNGERSAVSAVEESLSAIAEKDGPIGSFLNLTQELALETARSVDDQVKAGNPLPLLAGVPIAVKDNINVTGYPTTCASKILAGYVSPYDATVTQKLKTHLMPIVGKTNMDEFAMGSSTENSALKTTRNPWDLKRVPGGSSGGSATCVASEQVLLSLGSDTGGSVRQPASMCGLVGLKPTYGRVSRYGLVAFGSSLDQVSPFARNVRDMAAILSVIAGPDVKDATTNGESVSTAYLNTLDSWISQQGSGDQPLKGMKVGLIQQLLGDGMQPEVQAMLQTAQETVQKLGGTLHTLSIPAIDYGINAYYILAPAEASSNLARFDGVRYGRRVAAETDGLRTMYRKTRGEGFGAEVKRRIMLGTYVLSAGYYDAYYGKAQKARLLLKQEFERAFEQVDVMITPTNPTTAFPMGEKVNDPVSMYLEDIATIPISMAGIPAISIPAGFDNQNLPIGLQIVGPNWSEQTLLQVAYAYEQVSGLKNMTPAASPAAVTA